MVWLRAYFADHLPEQSRQTRGERELKARHWLIAKTVKPITS
jgi:hypothetical protein